MGVTRESAIIMQLFLRANPIATGQFPTKRNKELMNIWKPKIYAKLNVAVSNVNYFNNTFQ